MTILEKSQASVSRALKPEETLQGVCSKGCILRLNGSERHEFIVEPDQRLSIEGGDIFLDGIDTPSQPSQDTPNPPASPPPR